MRKTIATTMLVLASLAVPATADAKPLLHPARETVTTTSTTNTTRTIESIRAYLRCRMDPRNCVSKTGAVTTNVVNIPRALAWRSRG